MTAAFDAIFFDNDGVLVDTEPLFLKATQEILDSVDIRLAAKDYDDISMRDGRSVFDLAAERGFSTVEIKALRARRDLRYSALLDEGVAIFDGVVESLERLHGSVPMAIVTSSDRGNLEAMHEQTGLLRFFEFSVANFEYSEGKPHPAPYLAAAERLSVDPGRCLAIEDTERGLRSATTAGMSCIVIPNELSKYGDFELAERVFRSIDELLPFLEGRDLGL
jgi:HAD superfamily hydrolase (TIGR01509 family)